MSGFDFCWQQTLLGDKGHHAILSLSLKTVNLSRHCTIFDQVDYDTKVQLTVSKVPEQ